jgi:ribosomal protein L40E
MPKKRHSSVIESDYKLCQKCGAKNSIKRVACSECESERFAPQYVREFVALNRQFIVQITETQDEDTGKPRLRLTLYKWWPGGRSSFHVNTPEQWEKVKTIVDGTLSPKLGWKTKQEAAKELREIAATEAQENKALKKLATGSRVQKFLKSINFDTIAADDSEEIAEIIQELGNVASKADRSLLKRFRGVITKLKSEPKEAVAELENLLGTWSLTQITQITRDVTGRIQHLKLFKERVLDDQTYEIRGDHSIHRVLEKSMWIIDERYWLMHSNKTLREVVGKELESEDKSFAKKRPDFVCGTVDGKIVIVELKRPSHELTIEDLNQLETYVAIIEKNTNIPLSKAILMGRRISAELRNRMKYRSQAFKIFNYAEIIDKTLQRYEKYLEANVE